MNDQPSGRQQVVAELRWLADQPGGIPHRALLFRAAYIIQHAPEIVAEHPEQERHGDQTT